MFLLICFIAFGIYSLATYEVDKRNGINGKFIRDLFVKQNLYYSFNF